ncbi:MAG: efflux RND transporter periplasmic adaptor subunit [Rhizobiales bacterium]|jgi:RND family efflux transporter MFP subunit|nr:efflux RND transporter periplasmic adaptor subunit [Hyphomicrobiales bacterium]
MSIAIAARSALPLLLVAPLLIACGQQQPPAAAPPPPSVTVATPVKRTITDMDEYVGRFIAVDSVEMRARVSGSLEKVHFSDGQLVKQGDLLFTIDKRPFQNALDQAKANLAQARANLAFAESDLARAAQLVRERTISEQVFEQRTQTKRTADATVAAQEAAVRQAALDLEFTELRAPIAGRIGDRRVSPGNLVTGGNGGNTTLLATIVSTDPIRFEFTFDEASYLRYERMGSKSKEAANRGKGVPVTLKLIDEKDFGHDGKIDFVDNVIDRSSGTIRGRAEFSNAKGLFTPGMFGRIKVPGSEPYEALLVPDVAIGTEQIRKYVMVVDKEDKVAPKYVTLGDLSGDLRVIKSGLAPDDRVVINGLARLRPGIKVSPKTEAPASADAKPKTD